MEIEKSQYFRNRSTDRDEILPEHADYCCKLFEKLKSAYSILEIELSLYLRNSSSDHDEILHEHADWGRKQWGS